MVKRQVVVDRRSSGWKRGDEYSMQKTTGTVKALELVGPLTRWSAYECVVFTEGPGSWRPVSLIAAKALGTQCACVDQVTTNDDGKTAQLRGFWTEPRVRSSHGVEASS